MSAPICPYCRSAAELVCGETIYPLRADLAALKYWRCNPCDAHVGCHAAGTGYGDGTRPLGRLANADLRMWKAKAHTIFDAFWKQRGIGRSAAYQRLAKDLNIDTMDCHIGMFDVEQCKLVIQKVNGW